MNGKTYRPEDIARLFKVELKRVIDWLRDETLKGTKAGKDWVINEEEMINFLQLTPTVLVAGMRRGFLDGPESKAQFYYPEGLAIDRYGRILVCDSQNHRIRVIDESRMVSTIAGSGIKGSDDGSVATAQFNNPVDIAVADNGDIFIADCNNHLIRKIDTKGNVTTIAGKTTKGFQDGRGEKARFYRPRSIAINAKGNLVVADSENHAIREVTPEGEVTTIVGNGAGYQDGPIKEAKFSLPYSLTIDRSGNIVVFDKENGHIRMIDEHGMVYTLIGGKSMKAELLYNKLFDDCNVEQVPLMSVGGMAFDQEGNLYITEQQWHVIRKVDTQGNVTVIAGDGTNNYKEGLGRNTKFNQPSGLVVDKQGNLIIADRDNHRVRKVLTPLLLRYWEERAAIPRSAQETQEMPSLDLEAIRQNESVSRLEVSTLNKINATSLATDASGRLYAIIKDHICELFADGTTRNICQSRNGAAFAVADDGTICHYTSGQINKFTPNTETKFTDQNGEHGDNVAIPFKEIASITVDRSGNFYCACQTERLIYKLDTSNQISIYCGSGQQGHRDGDASSATFARLDGLVMSSKGELFIVDTDRIRKMDSEGNVTTINLNSKEKLRYPARICIDDDQNLYVSDTMAHVIWQIDPQGKIRVYAGRKRRGMTDGAALDAQFDHPLSIAINKDKLLFVVDSRNGVVRLVKRNDQEWTDVDRAPMVVVSAAATSTTKKVVLHTEKFSETEPTLKNDAVAIRRAIAEKERLIKSEQLDNTEPISKTEKLMLPTHLAGFVYQEEPEYEPLPPPEAYYSVYLDERNNPCGLVFLDQFAQQRAQQVDAKEVLEALESTQDLGRTISAINLLALVLQHHPEFTVRAQEGLLKLIPDERLHHCVINGHAHALGSVGSLAIAPYLSILRGYDMEEKLIGLIKALLLSVKNQHHKQLYFSILNFFTENFSTLSPEMAEGPARMLSDSIIEMIADRDRSSFERISAFEMFEWLEKWNRVRPAIFSLGRERAINLLVNILQDKHENPEVRDYIEKRLILIAPQTISKLQEKHFIEEMPLPDFPSLEFDYSGRPSQSLLQRMAIAVNPWQVLEVLQERNVDNFGQLFSAIYLAPLMANRFDWRALAHGLVRLLSMRDEYQFHIDQNRKTKVKVNRAASDNLIELLKKRDSAVRADVVEVALRSMDLVLDEGFHAFHTPELPIWEYLGLLTTLNANQEMRSNLTRCIYSRWRTPVARFLALYNLRDGAMGNYIFDVLNDRSENPGFRALVGSIVYQYNRTAVENLVDHSEKIWRLKEGSCEDLPISQPEEHVPLSWLVASLLAATDRFTRHRAINLFYNRINEDAWSREEISALRVRLLAVLESLPNRFLEALRLAADDASHSNLGRNSAAIMLALIGEPADEQRLAHSALTNGGWSTIEPFTENWTPVNVLMSVVNGDNLHEELWNSLEPYLEIGFGTEQAMAIRARIFVLYAEQQFNAQHYDLAQRFYRYAVSLDANNIMARQGLKKLDEL